MANTFSVTPLADGNRKVTVHSEGERDLSATVSADELDEKVRQAHNQQHQVYLDALNNPASLSDDAKESGTDTPPPEKAKSK